MNYKDRTALYSSLQGLRGNHHLLVYVTSLRASAVNSQMSPDVIPHVARSLAKLKERDSGSDRLDFLVISNGGDPNTAWRIVDMARAVYKELHVIVPYSAFSAATLIALGADKIVMHPFSHLGPVDPQIAVPLSNGQQIRFGWEDLRNYLEFVKSDVGISDQAQLSAAFGVMANQLNPVLIGTAKRSSQLAMSLAEKLLGKHISDKTRAQTIAEALNRKFYHHGYPLGPAEANEIGLDVVQAEGEEATILWSIWESFEAEMECNNPFDPVESLVNSFGTKFLQAPQGGLCEVTVKMLNAALETESNSIQYHSEYIIAGAGGQAQLLKKSGRWTMIVDQEEQV